MKCTVRTALFIAAFCSSYLFADGQAITRSTDTLKDPHPTYTPAKPKGPKNISHELSGGIRINSDGGIIGGVASIFVDIGKIKTKDSRHADMFYNIRFWRIEFTEKKSPSEYKSTGAGGNTNNTYIYGKINNFYAFKLGRGFTRMIAGKPDPGSVSIHWLNEGGISIGLLKPYYLDVYSDPNAIKYTDDTKVDFLDQTVIEGSAGFGKGLSEIKVIPGAHIQSALHFDFSANRKTVLGVEVGVNFEYYSQAIPLMANQSATPYFADLYVSVQAGKRW